MPSDALRYPPVPSDQSAIGQYLRAPCGRAYPPSVRPPSARVGPSGSRNPTCGIAVVPYATCHAEHVQTVTVVLTVVVALTVYLPKWPWW
jgi:hypothetical protein